MRLLVFISLGRSASLDFSSALAQLSSFLSFPLASNDINIAINRSSAAVLLAKTSLFARGKLGKSNRTGIAPEVMASGYRTRQSTATNKGKHAAVFSAVGRPVLS